MSVIPAAMTKMWKANKRQTQNINNHYNNNTKMSESNLINNSGKKTLNTSALCKKPQNHACYCHCLILIQSEVSNI